MTKFVGGALQAEFMARVRGVDPGRCLVVPVDIGKSIAMALVADRFGEMIVEPFEFDLTEPGVATLLAVVARAASARDAVVCRIGVECSGHYHRTLVSRLRQADLEVVELNPAAVKEARSQQLLRTLKSDARDLGAMAELMIRGSGRPPQSRTDAVAAQAAWVAHRRRKLGAHQALANQVQSQVDLVFPGLGACFSDLLGAKAGRVILTDICDPDRICHLGPSRLRAFVARRGVRMSGPKTDQVLQAARNALRLPHAERAVLGAVLAADGLARHPRNRADSSRDRAIGDPARHPGRNLDHPPRRGRHPGIHLRGSHRRSLAVPQRRRRLPGLRARAHRIRVSQETPPRPAHQPGRLRAAAGGHHRARQRIDRPPRRLRRLPSPADRPGEETSGRRRHSGRAPSPPSRLRHAAHPTALRPCSMAAIGGRRSHHQIEEPNTSKTIQPGPRPDPTTNSLQPEPGDTAAGARTDVDLSLEALRGLRT
jgi:transposase